MDRPMLSGWNGRADAWIMGGMDEGWLAAGKVSWLDLWMDG